MIALAAMRKTLKQVNFCDASELMPHFAEIFFNTSIYFQPIVKQIVVIINNFRFINILIKQFQIN